MWRATAPRAIVATPRSVRAKRAARATMDGRAAGRACGIDVMSPGSHQGVCGTARLTGVPGCGLPYASDVAAHAAGDVDRRARDVARSLAEQERDQARDLVRRAEAAERHLLFGVALEELVARQ